MKRRLALTLIGAALAAQDLPLAGWFQTGGAVVRVWGVAGNLVARGDAYPGDLVAARGTVMVLSDGGELAVIDNGVEVRRQMASCAGFDGEGRVVFDAWRELGEGEELLAIGGDALLVRRGENAWIETKRGGMAALGAGVVRGVLWSDGAALIEREGRLWYRTAEGEESDLGECMAGVLAVTGEEWAQAGGWAIRRRGAMAEKYLLPERAAE